MSLEDNIAAYLAQYRDWDSDTDLADAILALVRAHLTSDEAVEAGAAAYLASTGTMFTWDYVVRNDPAWAERLRAASRAALTAADAITAALGDHP